MYFHLKERTLDAEPTTQDGSNSSNGLNQIFNSERTHHRSWKFMEKLMLKTEISISVNFNQEP
jgi:hypothetical protein